jgi:transposase
MGIEIARGTMARLTIKVGSALAPVIERLQEDLRICSAVGMDETVVQVLKESERKPETQSRMWVARGYAARGYRDTGPILLFSYSPSRSGSVAANLLGPGFKGYLQTDGFAGYNAIGLREGIVHVGCWAHIRRKFHHLGDAGPDAPGNLAVRMIGELYHIEDELRESLAKGTISEAAFVMNRKERTAPVFERIRTWLLETAKIVAPKSPLGQAVSYALGQFEAASRYVGHPALTPDNNLVENAIRPFVIGRKNWLFSDTPKGAWASATIYSLVETARANGHEPYRYLCHLLDRLPSAKDPSQVADLLPYNLKPKSY